MVLLFLHFLQGCSVASGLVSDRKGKFQRLSLSHFYLYDPYPMGQRTNKQFLLVDKCAYSIYTFGNWGNNHIVGLGTNCSHESKLNPDSIYHLITVNSHFDRWVTVDLGPQKLVLDQSWCLVISENAGHFFLPVHNHPRKRQQVSLGNAWRKIHGIYCGSDTGAFFEEIQSVFLSWGSESVNCVNSTNLEERLWLTTVVSQSGFWVPDLDILSYYIS